MSGSKKKATNREYVYNLQASIRAARASAYYHTAVDEYTRRHQPKFVFDKVYQHLFSRVRDDERPMDLNPTMFVPKLPAKPSRRDTTRSKVQICIQDYCLQHYHPEYAKSPLPLFCHCLQTIVKNLTAYDIDCVREILSCQPPVYNELFHYYCATIGDMQDESFAETIFKRITDLHFPAMVSGESIRLIAQRLLSVGKVTHSEVDDWEDIQEFEDSIDPRRDIESITFHETEIHLHHLQSIKECFPRVKRLHFLGVKIWSDRSSWNTDCDQTSPTTSNTTTAIATSSSSQQREEQDSADETVAGVIETLAAEQVQEISFVCCPFVTMAFLFHLAALLSPASDLKAITIVSIPGTTPLSDNLSYKRKFSDVLERKNIRLNLVN